MKKRFFLALAFTLLVLGVITFALLTSNGPELKPAGVIADRQKNLMIFTTLLSLVVIVPVFILTFAIAWRYREGNTKARYTPDWDGHKLLEIIWWGIPCAIILVLGIVTWQTSHQLDPFKPLNTTEKPVTIQVVALQWKWLFLYPDEHIATVNFVQFPEKTPVRFQITSDAPMNSFWIPALGSQIYAMSGMSTELNLEANHTGVFQGASANISGEGFADMHFVAHAVTRTDYDKWANTVRGSAASLGSDTYAELRKPSRGTKTASYLLTEPELYNTIVMKYMTPGNGPVEGQY
jgi:cytochrome o ubiquinol oxidase subunit 2